MVIVARETAGRTLIHVAKTEAAGVAVARPNIGAGSRFMLMKISL